MKFLATFIAFVVTVAGTAIDKRQLAGLFGGALAKPDKITETKPRTRNNAKRSLIRWGPFELPAANATNRPGGSLLDLLNKPMDPNGFIISKTLNEGICRDCTVLAGQTDITFADGTRADINNGIYLHHILVIDRSKTSPDFVSFCPVKGDSTGTRTKNPLGSTFLGGAVNEFVTWYTTPDGKYDSGYYIKNDTFALQAEVVNYKMVPQTVYVTMDIEYVSGKVGVESMSTLLTVTGCTGTPGWHSKEKQNKVTSGDFVITGDGTIINARGHMHDGGELMKLYLNGKEICTSNAIYGGKGGTVNIDGKKWETISEMSDCNNEVVVKKGDYLRMEAQYDMAKHPVRESHGMEMEEMGIFTFSFVPSSGS